MTRLFKGAWTTVPFQELPPEVGTPFRWAGSTLMDEEQYRVEQWERATSGSGTYWRASKSGMIEHSRLRHDTRSERREAWRDREEEDKQGWLDRLVESAE